MKIDKKCEEHPNYGVKRRPSTACLSCWKIWDDAQKNKISQLNERIEDLEFKLGIDKKESKPKVKRPNTLSNATAPAKGESAIPKDVVDNLKNVDFTNIVRDHFG